MFIIKKNFNLKTIKIYFIILKLEKSLFEIIFKLNFFNII